MNNGQSALQDEVRPLSLPPEVVELMVEKLNLFDGVDLLVFSEGKREIADGIRKACSGAIITCVEQEVSLRRILRFNGYDLMDAGDFLKIDCWPGFDRIALIPPFMHGQEIKHVRHAFLMLKPGGRLVAVVTEGSIHQVDCKINGFTQLGNRLGQTSPASQRTESDANGLRDWLNEIGGEIEKLPNELLLEGDGTEMTRLRIVVINKPEESTDGATAVAKLAEVFPFTQVIPVTAAGA